MEPTTEQIVEWVRAQKYTFKYCPRCRQAPYHGATIRCLGCGLGFETNTYIIDYYIKDAKWKYLGFVLAKEKLGFWHVSEAGGVSYEHCSETGFAAYNLLRKQYGREELHRSYARVHPDRECILWQQSLAKIKESLCHLK